MGDIKIICGGCEWEAGPDRLEKMGGLPEACPSCGGKRFDVEKAEVVDEREEVYEERGVKDQYELKHIEEMSSHKWRD